MKPRGKWQGMLTILRFNWPLYLIAAAVFLIALTGLLGGFPPLIQIVSSLVLAGSGYFWVGSLGVSHLIYDRSDLYRWRWLTRALAGAPTHRIGFCHTGFDESSAALRHQLTFTDWVQLDHYDPARMTEPSIRRARRLFPPVAGTSSAPFDHWPVESASLDGVFALLAIHELRHEKERTAWFTEARRSLKPGGRIVLVEHVRDLANFLAFGPGFFHFHSPASWRRSWTDAGLRLTDEFRLTPWVRVFVISPA